MVTTPWYRQFWPWFLLLIPGLTVIAGIVTWYFALQRPVILVDGAYTKVGPVVTQTNSSQQSSQRNSHNK